MYWHPQDYETMVRLAIDVYLDYRFTKFPIDEKDVCKKLGISLVPYSAYDDITTDITLADLSKDAFYLPPSRKNNPIILYNDKIESEGRVRFSIFHELKHFLNNDQEENDYNEDMADYFSRYFMCPIPALISKGVDDIASIISDYNVSAEVAYNVLSNLKNRRRKYGNQIFEYEKPLVELIESTTASDEWCVF